MNKLKYIIISILLMSTNLYAVEPYQILAVDTNNSYVTYTNEVKFSNGVYSSFGIKTGTNPSITDSNIATLGDINAIVTNRDNASYWVTNTFVVSNSLDFSITLQDNRVMLDDIRMYISTTNNSPVSKRASIQLFRNSNRRCDKLVYLDTNQLYWTSLNTVATTEGSTSNTVSDASGVILNDLYYIGDNTLTNEFCRPTNTTSSIIYWGSTNIYAYTTTSLVSHVNQFGGFPYYDQNNTSQLWFRIQFTTPWTTTVQTVINYGK
jgi:hypothetical protein